jgi:hypothetical protein
MALINDGAKILFSVIASLIGFLALVQKSGRCPRSGGRVCVSHYSLEMHATSGVSL